MCVGYLQDGNKPVTLDDAAKERFFEQSRELGLKGLRGTFFRVL